MIRPERPRVIARVIAPDDMSAEDAEQWWRSIPTGDSDHELDELDPRHR